MLLEWSAALLEAYGGGGNSLEEVFEERKSWEVDGGGKEKEI